VTPKKPVIAWIVIVVGSLVALANLLTLLTAAASVGRRSAKEIVVTVLLSLLVAGGSILVVRGTLRGTLGSRLWVSLYLWSILLIYPIHNVLRTFGLYLPRPELSDQELAGAAFVELMRYVVLIALIVWVALSKSLKMYLSQPFPNGAPELSK